MNNEGLSATKRRTRKLIRDSFIELSKQKSFEAITVKELCALADVNKVTFYRYYSDLYALADDVSNELYNRLFVNIYDEGQLPRGNSRESAYGYILEACSVIEKNMELCKIYFENAQRASFTDRLLNALLNDFDTFYKGYYSKKTEAYVASRFLYSGLLGVCREWLKGDCKTPKETVAKTLDKILYTVFVMMKEYI